MTEGEAVFNNTRIKIKFKRATKRGNVGEIVCSCGPEIESTTEVLKN